MKLRVAVWLVVGIILIIGVLFLVLTGKSSQRKKVTLEDLKRQATRTESSINALTGRLAQAKAIPLPPEKTPLLTENENILNRAREMVQKAKNSSDFRTAFESLREAHRLIRKSRRLLHKATTPQPLRSN
ncbi:MAG: hypothetical protein ACUVUD_03185 [bacterium]